MIRKLMLVALMALGVTAAACNTVRGAGDDLQSAANTVDNGM